MRPPRFRIRTLLMAVAIVGLVSAFFVWGERRRAEFKRLADRYGANRIRSPVNSEDSYGLWRDELAGKYTYAARYPWLPVWPDTAPPRK